MIVVYADGACRGNPGPMAIGVSIQSADGMELDTLSALLGEGTNNQAEYYAAIAGVRKAIKHGTDEIELLMDSQLVVKQLTGGVSDQERRIETATATAAYPADAVHEVLGHVDTARE